jgi:hypothetical protein
MQKIVFKHDRYIDFMSKQQTEQASQFALQAHEQAVRGMDEDQLVLFAENRRLRQQLEKYQRDKELLKVQIDGLMRMNDTLMRQRGLVDWNAPQLRP